MASPLVDWDAGTLFIGLTKNGDPWLAPLSEEALARLRGIPRLANNPYIVCGKLPDQYFRELGLIPIEVDREALNGAHEQGLRLTHLDTLFAIFEHAHKRVLHEILDLLTLAPPTMQDAAHLAEIADQ